MTQSKFKRNFKNLTFGPDSAIIVQIESTIAPYMKLHHCNKSLANQIVWFCLSVQRELYLTLWQHI
jgi:hypothetical protein